MVSLGHTGIDERLACSNDINGVDSILTQVCYSVRSVSELSTGLPLSPLGSPSTGGSMVHRLIFG